MRHAIPAKAPDIQPKVVSVRRSESRKAEALGTMPPWLRSVVPVFDLLHIADSTDSLNGEIT
jgi:hypothetical protein